MKNRMTKIIALVLALVLVTVSGACVQAFAKEDFDEVVAEEYGSTIQGLINGEEVEYTYNGKPMSYDLSVIADMVKAQQCMENGENSADFESSRGADAAPTHQRICANALAILLHDKGTSVFASTDAFMSHAADTEEDDYESYAEFIVYHAATPDEDETGTYNGDDADGRPIYVEDTLSFKWGGMTYSLSMFSGHFYDPYTELNWKDSSSNTCKMNARRHYNAAVSLYNAGNLEGAFEELGRGCHYVQDACQTQHANNLTAKDDGLINGATGNNRHGIFENDVDAYIRNHMPYTAKLAASQDVFDSSVYEEALKLEIEDIVRNNCYSSYILLDKSDYQQTRDLNNTTDYNDSARAQFKNATMACVQYIWHFANDVGITFTK